MSIDYEFHSIQDDVVGGKFFSKHGKDVYFHVVETEEYPYSIINTIDAYTPRREEWAGTLSIHGKHKKAGWPMFQLQIRKITGWKIGILDIDKMVTQCMIWKLHNL